MSPPNIRLRGMRSPKIPGGYLIGRMPGVKAGEPQLLDIRQLRGFGLAPATAAAQSATAAGFGFYDGGLLLAGELLGTAIYGHDVTFTNGADGDTVTSLGAFTSAAAFTLVAPDTLGVPTQVGEINFNAGGTVGTVNWSPNPFLLLKATPLKLYAPAVADPTGSDITGLVTGVRGG